jgi:peptidoglycan/LPS O-acetylase OafA/YrhL
MVGTPFRWGDAGVEFFFVLSGFIIASAHAGDISRPARLIPYLQRRIIRIYPPYWIIFAIVCAMALPLAATRAYQWLRWRTGTSTASDWPAASSSY